MVCVDPTGPLAWSDTFETHFEILEWKTEEEGRDLLTLEIRAELSDYSEGRSLDSHGDRDARKGQRMIWTGRYSQ